MFSFAYPYGNSLSGSMCVWLGVILLNTCVGERKLFFRSGINCKRCSERENWYLSSNLGPGDEIPLLWPSMIKYVGLVMFILVERLLRDNQILQRSILYIVLSKLRI